MKKISLYFICILFLTNCNKIPPCKNCNFTCIDSNETDIIINSCKTKWDCNFNLISNSKVNINEFEGFTTGNKLVFQMLNKNEDNPQISDDEITNIMVFELDDNLKSFSLMDNQLKNINLHYRHYCYCVDIDYKQISSGCIQGEKQSNGSWYIQGNFTINYSWGEEEVKFEARFNY